MLTDDTSDAPDTPMTDTPRVAMKPVAVAGLPRMIRVGKDGETVLLSLNDLASALDMSPWRARSRVASRTRHIQNTMPGGRRMEVLDLTTAKELIAYARSQPKGDFDMVTATIGGAERELPSVMCRVVGTQATAPHIRLSDVAAALGLVYTTAQRRLNVNLEAVEGDEDHKWYPLIAQRRRVEFVSDREPNALGPMTLVWPATLATVLADCVSTTRPVGRPRKDAA